MIKYSLLISLAVIVSCSDAQNQDDHPKEKTLCDCHEIQLKAAKEFQTAKGDADAIKGLQEKYKALKEACQKVVAEMSAEMKGRSDEEKKALEKEHEENCPAFGELQALKSAKLNK